MESGIKIHCVEIYTLCRNVLVSTPNAAIDEQPADKTSPKKTRAKSFGMSDMLADNPHGLTETVITEYLALRKAKRAPMTVNVWAALTTELHKCVAVGITADAAMAEALLNGWQGFKVDWIVKRIGTNNAVSAGMSRHVNFAANDYTDGLGAQREDGSYEI
jgi:hypothetical protein